MIFELLPVGEANAIPGRELAKILGVDMRGMTEQVEKERRKGLPICATSSGSPSGYYAASCDEELELYCRRLKHRRDELDATLQALKNSINRGA